MKEPYEQGLANQFGLESCAGFREETGEALTEVNPGQPWSSENISFARADLVLSGGRPHGEKRTTRVSLRRHGVADPAHGSTLTSRKPGDLGGSRRPAAGGTVGKGVMPCVR